MAVGYIGSIRVQDVLTGKWYSYAAYPNDSWDVQPIKITPWGGLYVAAWIQNFSGSPHTLTASIYSDAKEFVSKTETVEHEGAFGLETGTVGIPNTPTTINVKVVTEAGNTYIFSFTCEVGEPLGPTIPCPVCGELFFTQAQLDEHLLIHQAPPEEPPTGGGIPVGPCICRMIKIPETGLVWIRKNVRSYLPDWAVRTYYGVSKAVFEIL